MRPFRLGCTARLHGDVNGNQAQYVTYLLFRYPSAADGKCYSVWGKFFILAMFQLPLAADGDCGPAQAMPVQPFQLPPVANSGCNCRIVSAFGERPAPFETSDDYIIPSYEAFFKPIGADLKSNGPALLVRAVSPACL